MLDTIDSHVAGFGTRKTEDCQNAVFIAMKLFNLDLPLEYKGMGRVGVECLRLYCILRNDLYIYQILEGLRFWPGSLWRWKFSKMEKYFQNIDKELEDLIKQENETASNLSSVERRKLNLDIRKLSGKAREFPRSNQSNFTGRYPKSPTRFGNVLIEYEEYSLNRYGIHMMVFWNHIKQQIPKEVKEELNLKSAIADICVYLCLASLVYIFIGPLSLLLQKDSWIMIWDHLFPLKSFLYLLLSIIAFKAFYELSITHRKNYGRLVKSIFDLYRLELAKSLGIRIKKRYHTTEEEIDEEKALWEEYQYYFLDYNLLHKKFASSFEELDEI
ncbi:MAG: hypothetical protein AYK19_12270 [Theionarchaea archaeon DG-70-1]|nr:MAG: hypothetical protein AYK19_12270 [Theionarchaea archaeon DG-70-1]